MAAWACKHSVHTLFLFWLRYKQWPDSDMPENTTGKTNQPKDKIVQNLMACMFSKGSL